MLPPTTDQSAPAASHGWAHEQVTEETVNQLMIRKFTEIVASYDQRKHAGSLQELATGPWYPNDYAAALEKRGQGKRLEWLRTKDAFFHGFPPKGFISQPNPATLTKIDPSSYQIKPEFQPFQALENVKTGQFSFTDCGSAVELAMYETLKVVLGEARFNEIFSAEGQSPLKLHPHVLKTPLYSLGFVKEAMLDLDAISPNLGDNVYFSNIPLYTIKHPNGESKGFHAVCISPSDVVNKRYIAFGAPARGLTEGEMNDFMVAEFNAPPVNPYQIFTKQMAAHFQLECQQAEAKFTARSGIKIADFKIDRDQFEQTVQQTAHKMAGLSPIVKRLDIDAIRKYMISNADD
jgi:hypothetical protein